jgi:hypothetical protein
MVSVAGGNVPGLARQEFILRRNELRVLHKHLIHAFAVQILPLLFAGRNHLMVPEN